MRVIVTYENHTLLLTVVSPDMPLLQGWQNGF